MYVSGAYPTIIRLTGMPFCMRSSTSTQKKVIPPPVQIPTSPHDGGGAREGPTPPVTPTYPPRRSETLAAAAPAVPNVHVTEYKFVLNQTIRETQQPNGSVAISINTWMLRPPTFPTHISSLQTAAIPQSLLQTAFAERRWCSHSQTFTQRPPFQHACADCDAEMGLL